MCLNTEISVILRYQTRYTMKRTYLLFMCVLASLVMTAAQLTKDQAKQTAEQFLKQKVSKVATVKATQVVPIRQAQASAHDNSSKTTAYAVNLGKNDGLIRTARIITR